MEGQKIRLLMLGGGHCNSLAVLELVKIKEIEIVMVSDGRYSYYSGMMPGLIAGIYNENDVKIDLQGLAEKYGFTFIPHKAVFVNATEKFVELEDQTKITYDILCINIGSTNRQIDYPGIREFTIPTRPLYNLIHRMDSITNAQSFVIVGGGMAGLELSFSIRAKHKLAEISIVHKDPIGQEVNAKAQKIIENNLQSLKINDVIGMVVEVGQNRIKLEDGKEINSEYIVWATGAKAFDLRTDLEKASDGFILVDPCLKSVSHNDVLAAGDCISIAGFNNFPPKAGVYAVREADIIIKNVKALVQSKMSQKTASLIEYVPQKDFLKLINLCNGQAIAIKWGNAYQGRIAFRLKHGIDSNFMKKFRV